jgi:uncharacterized integral membrane protein (TIGR00697 family)
MKTFEKIYLILGCIFCTTVVTGNLIFQKFISLDIPYLPTLDISVGVLLYPITFLISDLLTEFYGKERAKFVVQVTVITSLIVMLLLYISIKLPAVHWSPISDIEFQKAFNVYGLGSLASIIAIYIGQLTDIIIFSWLKVKTNNKHLWLRNNVSTIIAQLIDTTTVLIILSIFNILPWQQFLDVFISSIIFKIIAALLDTPFCYLGHYLIKRLTKKND